MKYFAYLSLLIASGLAQAQVAFDQASNYGGGWNNGSNGGFGFGNWSLNSTPGTGFAGQFLGNPADAGISGMSTSSFGLFANPAASGASSTASRALSSALTVGQTLSVQWGVNFDTGGSGNKGFNLYTGGIGGTQLININQGGSATITINGNPMFSNYGTVAMTLNFEYLNATTLRVFGTGRDGLETYNQNFTIAGAPDAFQFYATELVGPSFQTERQPYFNNLSVVPEPATLGMLAFGALACVALNRKRKVFGKNQNK